MILLSKYNNYELIFMHNGQAIKFNSSSLQEIKDVNQILIDISYDFKRLRYVRRYKVNGRLYNLRYNNGIIKVLDSYDKRQNRYFMSDHQDINVVDNEKLNSKIIFEDSDDYLERNESHDVVLSSRHHENSSSEILRSPEIRSYPKKDSMRYKDEADVLDGYYGDVQKLESPRFLDAKPREYSKKYPQNINMPPLESDTVFKSSIKDEDPETRDKIIKLSSYVDASSHRSLVLNDINTSIKTPKTIATETGLRSNYVSKVLRDFKDRDIVVCINEEVRKGKLYELTPLGLKIFDYLRRV